MSLLYRRRDILLQGGALLASQLAPPASAQAGGLTVSNWGGDWNDRIVRVFEKPFSERTGVGIAHELAQVPERKTKLLAERRLPRGTIDIAHMTDADAFEMQIQDVLEELDLTQLPNYQHIYPELQSRYFVPWVYGGVVLLYNPDKIPEPPTSFAALWDKRYAGHVGVIDQIFFNYVYAASLINGGSMTNVEPGFAKLAEMKSSVEPRIYPSHQQLAAAFAAEEIWISANYTARVLQWQADGLPVRMAQPGEGAIAVTFGAVMPKRARNKPAAYAYLNSLLAPKVAGDFAEVSFYAPSIDNADMSPATRKVVEFTEEQRRKLNFVNNDYAARNASAWLDRWNKEFKS
jgi:putative spermidine/putrescine transport system substrate-binding protein